MRIFLFIVVLSLSGCLSPEQRLQRQQEQQRQAEAANLPERINAIEGDCERKRQNHEYKTYVQKAQECSKPRVMQLAEYLRPDFVPTLSLLYTKKLVILERLDKKEITKIQADAEIASILQQLITEQDERDRQQQQLNIQKAQVLMQYNALNPPQPLLPQPYQLKSPTLTTCNSNRFGNSISTTCY